MYATATSLPNGKVLLAGGKETDGLTVTVLASAELYDPSTGAFSPTGSMAAARADQTATLLPDGRVLIAGGDGCSKVASCRDAGPGSVTALASAELYDRTTGKFTNTGSMSAPHGHAAATLLSDGRVLLVGGYGKVADVYDETTGRFTRTGDSPMDIGNGDPTATLLANGKVLVTGMTASGPRAALYDSVSGVFTSISFPLPPGDAELMQQYSGPGPAPRRATLLKDGRVLLYGIGYVEIFDASTGAFAPAGLIPPSALWDPTATLLENGNVLFAGGAPVTDPNSYVPAAVVAALYDPNGGAHAIGSMDTARDGQTATLLPDGSVLIAGGTADGGNALSSAELFKQ
jgi:WD40 repeat protein